MDLTRLLHPRTIAVVGATERREAYGSETLINLRRAGFDGDVWAVNPGRSLAPTTATECGCKSGAGSSARLPPEAVIGGLRR